MSTVLTLALAAAIFQTTAQQPAGEFARGPSDAKFSAHTDKQSHPEPNPVPDKALVYVVRPTMFAHKIQSKFAVDGKWVGVNRGNNYFYTFLDAGLHQFCFSIGEQVDGECRAGGGKDLLFPTAHTNRNLEGSKLARTIG